jgi:hypothetical protein
MQDPLLRLQLAQFQYFSTQRILIHEAPEEIIIPFDWETFTHNAEWLREAVRIEEESGSDSSAGPNWGTHLGSVTPRISGAALLRPAACDC